MKNRSALVVLPGANGYRGRPVRVRFTEDRLVYRWVWYHPAVDWRARRYEGIGNGPHGWCW